MSAIEDWLGSDASLSEETLAMQTSPDEKVRDIGHRVIMRKRLKCADGFSMSVQYSAFHYCNARIKFMGGDRENESDPIPDPRTVEIGMPSKREPLIMEYAEERTMPTKTVYGWVPVEVVDKVIAKHGGLANDGP